MSQIIFSFLTQTKYNHAITPRFPLRQIGAFQPLRRDRARVRDGKMPWIVSKFLPSIFVLIVIIKKNFEDKFQLKKLSRFVIFVDDPSS